MTETVHPDYEVSSEGAIRHWEFPYADHFDVTPTPTNAMELTGRTVGIDLNGTILTIDAINSIAVDDVTTGMVYVHDVRNVLTYVGGAGGAEATWGPINIGDPVYYDPSTTMVALGIYLSTSPLTNNAGATANTRFGWVVPMPLSSGFDTDTARFPLGAALVASTQRVAVMQRGAGGG
jgi:hypothetical protein